MRIAILTSGVRGPASYSLNLYRHLIGAGHDVLLVSESRWKKDRVPMYEARSYPLLGLVPIVYRPGDVIRAIERFQPDVIHHQWPCGTMDLFVHRIVGLGVPVVATIHVAVNSTDFVWDRFFYLHFWWLKRRVAGLSALVSISTFVHEQVRERIDLQQSRVRLIPSGIDTNVFRPGPVEPDGPLNLLFVGQVMPEKGVDALIEAVRLVSNTVPVTLTIVGDGHLRRSLERATAGELAIVWAGFVPDQPRIASYYQAADLTILPTRWDEAFSLVPIESMACGTPVLATRKGGTPEIVREGDTGFLIDECRADLIANRLLALDRQQLASMRLRCRDFVLKTHTLAEWGQRHERLYEDVSLRRPEVR